MASPEPRARAAPVSRVVTAAAGGSNTGVLPLDAVYEILMRLPAKELCRLRSVCRPWRSLLSDPLFIETHGVRHPEPLIIVSNMDNVERDSIIDILDMSGRIVKKVRGKEGEIVTSMAFDLVCVKTIETGSFRLLNPASGAVYHLSDKLAEEHVAHGFNLRDYGEPVHLFGQVASTGDYKVLRMLEVCTINGSSRAPWRGKQAPPCPFVWNEWTRVVVCGVVYFLSVAAYFAFLNHQVIEQGWIVSFDLEAEQWRPNIRGPSNLVGDDMLSGYLGLDSRQLTLASLNSSLVLVHGPNPDMDLWFLMDSEMGLWVKQYSVQVERSGYLLPMHPLLVLYDGRIVTVIRSLRLLQIHDPRANTFTNLVRLRQCSGISMCTGNLLSLDDEN